MLEEILISAASALTLVIVLFNCLNCLFKKKGLQNFRSGDSHNAQHNPAFSVDVSDVPGALERVTIEPLPDILSKTSSATCFRPRITCRGQQEALLLLNTIHKHFPRDHLTYLNEMGTGWFGQVIESEAAHIVDGSSKTKVVVKMLKEDSTKIEQKYFMEEVSVYRCLDHVNLLSFLGQCTDILPHLAILEFSPLGNLKTHLVYHRPEAEKLIKKNHLVTFALDIAAGLACLHRHDFVHNDLAARNCLVMSNYTVKIGDYGISDTLFKEDYYNTGRELLPIRWMAPETLVMSNGIWTSNFGDKEADIWSFGMILWEIFTFGEVPYSYLGDESVLQGVVIEKTLFPSKSDLKVPMVDEIWSVIAQCFQNPYQRPNVELLHQNIEHIVKLDTIASITDFENRWEKLEPYKPELGSRTALAGSFNMDDLTPISDESFTLNGDSVTLNMQLDNDCLVDTEISARDNISANASAPVYSSQVQLSFEDEILSSVTDVKKHVAPVHPNPTKIVQHVQNDVTSQPSDANVESLGDGSFSPLQSPVFSVQDESKMSLLANESNNNVLALRMANHQLIFEEAANTSPKYPSNEFTDFLSAVEVEPEGNDVGRDFSDFVSSFSDDRDNASQILEIFTTKEIKTEENLATVVSDEIVIEERNSSGEFTDFVTSLPPLSLNANLDNCFEATSFESLPDMSKRTVESESVPLETTEYNLMPDVSLKTQETTEYNLVNMMPDVSLPANTLPSDFSFINDLYSEPVKDVQQPMASHQLLDLQEMSNDIENVLSEQVKNDLSQLIEVAQPITADLIIELAKHEEMDPGSDKVGSHDTQSHTPAVSNGFTSTDHLWDSSTQKIDEAYQVQREQVETVVCSDDLQQEVTCQREISHENTDICVPSGSPVPDDTCLSPSPDSNPQEDSDTEVSTSSSSGQEYICSEEPTAPEPPPPQVFGTHADLDEHTLQMVSEIYLSRGVKSPRVFEIPPLETIYENQAVVEEDEEDAANSDSSSESRHDDQFGGDFEWDDLLHSDSPPQQSQRKLIPSKEQSFSEWSFDLEDDGWDAHSNTANGSLSNTDFLNSNSSVLAKHLLPLPSSWPSVSHLNQNSLYSLMDDYPTDVTSPSEENFEESVSSLSPQSVSPISNPSSTPSAGPSLTLQSSHFLFPNNETSEPPHHESFPSNQQTLPSSSVITTESDHLHNHTPVLGTDVPVLTEDLSQHSLLLDLPLIADQSATALPIDQPVIASQSDQPI